MQPQDSGVRCGKSPVSHTTPKAWSGPLGHKRSQRSEKASAAKGPAQRKSSAVKEQRSERVAQRKSSAAKEQRSERVAQRKCQRSERAARRESAARQWRGSGGCQSPRKGAAGKSGGVWGGCNSPQGVWGVPSRRGRRHKEPLSFRNQTVFLIFYLNCYVHVLTMFYTPTNSDKLRGEALM